MLELYLDSADVAQIARFQASLPIRGVTTNPTILANAGVGVNQLLAELSPILGQTARFHVQVVSETVEAMLSEARAIANLPYDVVVKVPATETGLAVIKQLRREAICVLATAIYTSQQGFLAALAGANYLAPYVNRIDVFGGDGVKVVHELHQLIQQHDLDCCVLPASFKNPRQVLEVLQAGVGAITLPVDLMAQMFSHPAVPLAVQQFNNDWQQRFASLLAFQS